MLKSTKIFEGATMSTQDDLKSAFAGESQASRKYLYFAERAEQEHHPQVARLFRAAAEAETVHARGHLTALGGIGTTEDNLKAAIKGEHYEFTDMYPGFIAQAGLEGNQAAEKTFSRANEVEKTHHWLYMQALAVMDKGGMLPEGDYYVCPVCGQTVFDHAPEVCPICGTPGVKWTRVR
jgi:rubrerythrin